MQQLLLAANQGKTIKRLVVRTITPPASKMATKVVTKSIIKQPVRTGQVRQTLSRKPQGKSHGLVIFLEE